MAKYGDCFLIEGSWGSGKTSLYKEKFKCTRFAHIYISCFGANKAELITNIICSQPLFNLLTLNGFLSKLIQAYWQNFMPSRSVVVFDDLERLHSSPENYLDGMGIIDFLKTERKCYVILICNFSQTQIPELFNTYMERIVDEIIITPRIKLVNILEKNVNKINPIYNECIMHLQNLYDINRVENIRIIKRIYNNIKLIKFIKEFTSEKCNKKIL